MTEKTIMAGQLSGLWREIFVHDLNAVGSMLGCSAARWPRGRCVAGGDKHE